MRRLRKGKRDGSVRESRERYSSLIIQSMHQEVEAGGRVCEIEILNIRWRAVGRERRREEEDERRNER